MPAGRGRDAAELLGHSPNRCLPRRVRERLDQHVLGAGVALAGDNQPGDTPPLGGVETELGQARPDVRRQPGPRRAALERPNLVRGDAHLRRPPRAERVEGRGAQAGDRS